MSPLVAILRRLSSEGRGRAGASLFASVGLAVLAGFLSSSAPAFLGVAVDGVSGHRGAPARGIAARLALDGGSPTLAVGVALLVTGAAIAVSVVSSTTSASASASLSATLRVAMLRAALGTSARHLAEVGDSASSTPPGPPRPAPPRAGPPGAPPKGPEVAKVIIARDSNQLAEFLVAIFTGVPQAVVSLIVLLTEVLASGAKWAVVGSVVLFGASRALTGRASRRVATAMQEMQAEDTRVFGALGGALSMSEELRVLGAREQIVREFSLLADACAGARRRFAARAAASGQIRGVVTALSPLLVVLAIAASGSVTAPGDVAKLVLMVPLLMGRMEALDSLRLGMIERRALLESAERVLALPLWPPTPTTPRVPGGEGAVRFEHVRYTPPGASAPVLGDVTFDVPAGALVGICGRSGSGKSTLLRLLLRLDEPDSGSIRIDDVSLSDVDARRLPAVVAVAGQSTRLLERSLAENLTLGLDPAPPDAALTRALESVELPELSRRDGDRGLTTRVVHQPPNFSGGEQRRLGIARLLVRSAPVWVLDEPEASLPAGTAESLLALIAREAKGRTCIVVTHAPRLLASTFNVVLSGGTVVAQGTHAELAERCAEYQALLGETTG